MKQSIQSSGGSIEGGLHKELSLLEIASIGVGAMIGGTVFSTIGVVAMKSAVGELILFSLLLNTLITLAIGYNYAKLSAKYPSCGAGYAFVSKVFSRYTPLKLFIGYSTFFAYASACAFYSVVFSYYLMRIFNMNHLGLFTVKLIAIIIVFILVLINLSGVKNMGIVEDLLVLFKVSILLTVIILGFKLLDLTVVYKVASRPLSYLAKGILYGSATTFLGFEGFEAVVNAIEESRSKEHVKRGIFTSLAIASSIYLMVAWLAISMLENGLLQSDKIWHDETILGEITKHIIGTSGDLLLSLAALSATLSAANGSLYAVSRVLYAMSRDHIVPKVLNKLNRNGVPSNSIVLVGLMSIALIFFEAGVEKLGELTSLAFLLCFSLVSLANLKAREETCSSMVPCLIGFIGPLIIMTYAVFCTPRIAFLLIAWIIITVTIGFLIMRLSCRNEKEFK
ncbi:MAG: hypothetical protein DRN15_07550 [Thermoprotei archaeon]|nr:MAG: hypothetical protein DRN15_07550 [Thermoprotei archaeon]